MRQAPPLSKAGNVANSSTGEYGGGLYNIDGSVFISNTTILTNTAQYSDGGGLYNTGLVTLTESAILSNTALNLAEAGGGGLYNIGTATITNTTISGNKATKNGGGIASYNNGSVTATVTLANVTISNNTADSDSDNTGNGGGIERGNGVAYLRNTLIAGNTDASTTTKYHDCSGTFTSQGYNLIQATTGCTLSGDTTGNITGQSANLAALTNNGGSTLTHAPNTGSPAIDAGHPTICVAVDQRFYPRPFNGRCDIGAYEVGAQGVVSGSVTFIT